MFSYATNLVCSAKDGREYDLALANPVCECGAPLLVSYDTTALRRDHGRDDLSDEGDGLWRYHWMLPVHERTDLVRLGEMMSPIVRMKRLADAVGVDQLIIKDEARLPTGSFKCRGAAVGVSALRALGARSLVMPSNGNAGVAWSAYSANAGLGMTIVLPSRCPEAFAVECAALGATVRTVDGLIDQAGEVARSIAGSTGAYMSSTFNEPFRVEGKKTIAYELCEQLGWRCPDVIVYPTGGGVGLVGIYKALTEMLELGWIEGPLPRLVAVQAVGCAPIVKAFEQGRNRVEPWPNAHTVAFGMNVPFTKGGPLVLDALRATDGTAISVAEADIIKVYQESGRLDGLRIGLEGAATVAAVQSLKESGWLSAGEEILALNTGSAGGTV